MCGERAWEAGVSGPRPPGAPPAGLTESRRGLGLAEAVSVPGRGPCLPSLTPGTPAAQPSLTASPQTEEFFDLIASSQSRRLDDQRASVGSLPGLRITHNNLGHLRGDGDAQEPGDEFFNMLIKCQVGLQPGAPPYLRPGPLAGVSPGPLLAGALVPLSQGVLGEQPHPSRLAQPVTPWLLRPGGPFLGALRRSSRAGPPWSSGVKLGESWGPRGCGLGYPTSCLPLGGENRGPDCTPECGGHEGSSHPLVQAGVWETPGKWLGRGQPQRPPTATHAGSWEVSRCDIRSHRGEDSIALGESVEPPNQPLPRTPEPPAHMHVRSGDCAGSRPSCCRPCREGPPPLWAPDSMGLWGALHCPTLSLRLENTPEHHSLLGALGADLGGRLHSPVSGPVTPCGSL